MIPCNELACITPSCINALFIWLGLHVIALIWRSFVLSNSGSSCPKKHLQCPLAWLHIHTNQIKCNLAFQQNLPLPLAPDETKTKTTKRLLPSLYPLRPTVTNVPASQFNSIQPTPPINQTHASIHPSIYLSTHPIVSNIPKSLSPPPYEQEKEESEEKEEKGKAIYIQIVPPTLPTYERQKSSHHHLPTILIP